jgi:hypothetical protein
MFRKAYIRYPSDVGSDVHNVYALSFEKYKGK